MQWPLGNNKESKGIGPDQLSSKQNFQRNVEMKPGWTQCLVEKGEPPNPAFSELHRDMDWFWVFIYPRTHFILFILLLAISMIFFAFHL